MSDEPTRKITFEIPADVELSSEEMEALSEQFRSQVIDSKAEEITLRAKPKEKQKEVPVIVQGKEVAIPKEKQQTA